MQRDRKMTIENISVNKSFGGWHKQYSHYSNILNCTMQFAIFLPPQVVCGKKVPVIYWLSDVSCTEENFMQKAGVQRLAAELGVAIVAPDTSPRGDDIVDDVEHGLGQGAGFYVNATQAPWNRHYQMYDYVVDELPELIETHFPINEKSAISGHSMGGHGALVIAIRNPERYQSVSAFSPISNPMDVPWGQKAFTAYLGQDRESWASYDTCALMRKAKHFVPARVDQGESDGFLDDQLTSKKLSDAAKVSGYPLELNQHVDYDHSYYLISSFIEQHLRFHASHLNQ